MLNFRVLVFILFNIIIQLIHTRKVLSNFHSNSVFLSKLFTPSDSNLFSLKVFTQDDRIIIQNSFQKGSIQIIDDEIVISPSNSNPTYRLIENQIAREFEAIIGFYNISNRYYIALVDKISDVNLSLIKGIKKVERITILRIPDGQFNLDSNDKNTQASLKLLERTILEQSLYYSISKYDILRSYQSNICSNITNKFDPFDDRFFWNQASIIPLIKGELYSFVTPMCSIWTNSVSLNHCGKIFQFSLIARRSKRFQGPRFLKRGISLNGDVANFVEIEQIVCKDNLELSSSFLQIRGSIPIYWNQTILKSDSKLPQVNYQSNKKVLQRHNQDLLDYYIADIKKFSSYPHILFINLIDKKGRQGYLGRVWFKSLFYPRDPPKLDTLINRDEITITKVNLHNFLLTFLWFDFHHKYNPNLENNGLSELNPPISEIFDKIGGTFLVNKRKGVIDTQSTLIRTNCIDCLDRTNVVQSYISRMALKKQLQDLKLWRNLKDYFLTKESEILFREIWTNLGDHLSCLYAGSRAMKRDITKLGKRTNKGLIDDGYSYVKRYIMNNFLDKYKQKGIDIFLDNHLN